jgi:hypothetical protein
MLSRLSANHFGRSCEGNRRLAVMPEPWWNQFTMKWIPSFSPASLNPSRRTSAAFEKPHGPMWLPVRVRAQGAGPEQDASVGR